MKKNWFKKNGWIYTPSSWQGAIIVIMLIVFIVHAFIKIDKNAHSVSDTLYGVFPYVILAFLIYLWMGSNRSK